MQLAVSYVLNQAHYLLVLISGMPQVALPHAFKESHQ